jgi:hypothetical protein
MDRAEKNDVVKKQLYALIDSADYFNSDLTQIIARDNDENILAYFVFAKGEDAKALDRFFRRRARREQRADPS